MAEKATRRIEMIGSEADTHNSPDDMRYGYTGPGSIQMVGSEAELTMTTTPMGIFDKHVRGGKEEWIGSQTEMNETPHRGWESYDTPISKNTGTPTESKPHFPARPKYMRGE